MQQQTGLNKREGKPLPYFMEDIMIKIIEKRHQELVAGLAELYVNKSEIEKTIETQKAAIAECSLLAQKIEEAQKEV
jgi:superoxide dismutase